MNEKIAIITECKKNSDYIKLPFELQDELFYELMTPKEK